MSAALKTVLRKSLLIAPAEQALNDACTVQELEDAWFDFADGFADESPEREQLLRTYKARLDTLRGAERLLKLARAL